MHRVDYSLFLFDWTLELYRIAITSFFIAMYCLLYHKSGKSNALNLNSRNQSLIMHARDTTLHIHQHINITKAHAKFQPACLMVYR